MNRKSKKFIEIFNANTYSNFVKNISDAKDILEKCDSEIIKELLLNAINYRRLKKTYFYLNKITENDQIVIDKLREQGYKITIEEEQRRFSKWFYIEIEF